MKWYVSRLKQIINGTLIFFAWVSLASKAYSSESSTGRNTYETSFCMVACCAIVFLLVPSMSSDHAPVIDFLFRKQDKVAQSYSNECSTVRSTYGTSFYMVARCAIVFLLVPSKSLDRAPEINFLFGKQDKVVRSYSNEFSTGLSTYETSFNMVACCAIVFLLVPSKSSDRAPEINFLFRKQDKVVQS